MPYALRRARLTARVAAMRISAPCTIDETFEGSAAPYPTKAFNILGPYTTALKTQRLAAVSEKRRSRTVFMAEQRCLCAHRSSPECVTYHRLSSNRISPCEIDNLCLS